MMKSCAVAVAIVLVAGAPAVAQDFGVEWLDRILREVEEEAYPLTAKPAQVKWSVGELYYFDDNIFLESDDEESDSIFVTFGNARIEYAESQFDAVADLTVNYNLYVDEDDASDDEERFFGRARYVGPRLSIELAEVLRKESDPLDATFADRTERLVSNTIPLATFLLTRTLSIEANVNYQVVRFDEDRFEHLDNDSLYFNVAGVYETPRGLDLLVQVGFFDIDYDQDTATSADTDGFQVSGGLRGEVRPDLDLNLMLGWVDAESDDIGTTSNNSEHSTSRVSLGANYKATEKFNLWGDYGRDIGFSSASAPFQVADRLITRGEYEASERVKVTGRVQYDRVHPSTGDNRTYWSLGAGALYDAYKNIVVDGGLTWRSGDLDSGDDYSNLIFHLGAVASF